MTASSTQITFDAGDGAGVRQRSFADAQGLIHACLKAGQYSRAAAIATQLAGQLPGDAWCQLIAAETLSMLQQTGPAIRFIDRALSIEPRNIGALVVKARLCILTGDTDGALTAIDTAISSAPANARLYSEKGALLTDAGQIEAAGESFTKSLELDPRNIDALLALAQLPGQQVGADLISKIEFIVQSRQLGPEDQIKAHFALGHVYERKKAAARHFAHLQAGNALKGRSIRFDAAALKAEAARVTQFFDAEFLGRCEVEPASSANIIFIVGFPRCGSTLIEQVLSSHPSVSAAGETFALPHAIRDSGAALSPGVPYPEWLGQQSPDIMARLADEYLRRIERFRQGEYVTDKMLENYKHVGLIHLLFPRASIIHVQRNPVDVCFSCYKRLFNLQSVPYAYDLKNLAVAYRAYRACMRHWDEVLPGRVHTVDYEGFIDDPRSVTGKILQHCGLPWSDDCLDFQRNARIVQTTSNVQVRQPLFKSSIDRWKDYAGYLGPLLELTND